VAHAEHPPDEPCDSCAAVAAMDARGDMWAEGPDRDRKPPRVMVEVEIEGGTVLAPAFTDAETSRAMRLEAAGYEVDPETGQYRHGTWY
jgi:hypothetical protein